MTPQTSKLQPNKVNLTYSFRLSTITPVAVGDGGRISPLSDYYYDAVDKKIYFINKSEFESFIVNKNLIDDFLQTIENNIDVAKNDALLNFLQEHTEQNKKEVLERFFHKLTIPAFGIENPIEAQTIIKDAGRPYIPGSSLKGAIKTAILYYWLINNSFGQEALHNFKNAIMKGGFDDVFKEEIEKAVLGHISQGKKERMQYSMLKVLDTSPFDKTSIGMYQMKRLFLDDATPKGKTSNSSGTLLGDLLKDVITPTAILEDEPILPILKEAIQQGATTSFRIQLADNNLENPKDKHLQMLKQDITNLFGWLNTFSKHNLEYELAIIDSLDRKHQEIFKDYTDTLKERLKEINAFDNKPSAAYFRIGGGKNYYYNSMGLALFKSYPKEFLKFRERYKLQPNQKLFPRTRLLTTDSFMDFGWVKIEKI